MSIGSLEHMVRNRVRMFLRHTWLVTIVGTVILGALVWTAFYFTSEADHIRIAAGPLDGKFVQALSDQLAKQHRNLHLQLVSTAGAKDTAEAMSKDHADFAILPSNLDDSLNWPVVAILRQNVMVLIVPAPVAAKKGKKSAKIEKIDQLSGRRVGIVTGSEATTGLLELVLSHYGVALAKVTVSEIDPKNVADAPSRTIRSTRCSSPARRRDTPYPAQLARPPATAMRRVSSKSIRPTVSPNAIRPSTRSISMPARSVAIRPRRTTVSRA